MPSILQRTTARAAALVFMASSVSALNSTLNGCYSIATPLKEFAAQPTYLFQSPGYCQGNCTSLDQAALGLKNGNECWCGNEFPPLSAKVDDSECDTPCDGWQYDMCGGQNVWSVWSTGITDNVANYNGNTGSNGNSASSSSSSSSAPSSSTPISSSTPKPSVITKTSPGTTVIYTHEASSSSTATGNQKSNSKSGGVNTAAVAAGVVVAIVVVTAVVAGVFIWLRYRKRREAEEEYKRARAAEVARNNERKPPETSWSNLSDSRLEPAFTDRRNSHGSIADNQDFSRKILRVANPDRSSSFAPDRSSIFPPERSAWPPTRM